MSQWPIVKGPSYGVGLDTITTSRGTAITSGAANTKGSWAQIIASTAEHYQALLVTIKGAHAVLDRGIMDIGIGASTAEQVLVPDLRWLQGSTVIRAFIHSYFIPIGIASGTRVSARSASPTASYVSHVRVTGIPASMQFDPAFYQIDHYGIVTADSGATQIDCGATANTKGAYAVITASSTRQIKMFYVIITAANTTTPAAGADALIDVSIGAAAAEQVLAPDLPHCWSTDATIHHSRTSIYGPFYADIPSGTRIAARGQASGTDANGRLMDVSVLAFC
ncbi:MAG: hypothetical protein ACRDGM_00710 [bacterium]